MKIQYTGDEDLKRVLHEHVVKILHHKLYGWISTRLVQIRHQVNLKRRPAEEPSVADKALKDLELEIKMLFEE
jgi:hypothetical protein